ncbi:homocysteine S-methyltransferase [Halobacillus mangrovi]|uniref:S-methylmethionine:homocysteine methyltransferase n=1 Tax=Halobacillus mangrovi TaxID=402384 RepID=A0A1W5ZR06_9BACI|nr:homocysteine S-methyltransferase [Halobacillus mangrovi]ARI75721.1 homocysteine S-methyltransferase [Halobacillus mangrovi]
MTSINPIQAILDENEVMILDGALATELEKHGCDLDDPLWSARVLLENPGLIYQVHYDYFRSGADCAITASYQATVEGFAERGIGENEALDLIKETVVLARKARDDFWQEEGGTNRPKPLVAASVGPYGAYLADGSEYKGNYGVNDERLREFHQPRIKALVEAGADVLAIETIPSFREAKVISSLVKEFPDTYGWLSFTLKNGYAISDGTPLEECAQAFEEYDQIAAIGANCTPLTTASEAVATLNAHTEKPIIVYPNSGETYDPETNTWHGEGSDSFHTRDWYKRGARIVGGCCRTAPARIVEIAKAWRT